MAEEISNEIGVLPLRGLIPFPFLIMPLMLRERSSATLIKDVLENKKVIGLFSIKDILPKQDNEQDDFSEVEFNSENVNPDAIYKVGVSAKIGRFTRLADGTMKFLAQGLERILINKIISTEPYLKIQYTVLKEIRKNDTEEKALMNSALELFQRVALIAPYISEEAHITAMNLNDPGRLADLIAVNLNIDLSVKQKILEELDVSERLKILVNLLKQELTVLEITKEIRDKASSQIGEGQRDYLLREQMRIIQEELGEKDEKTKDIEDFETKIKELKLPKEVEESAFRELDRLRVMPPASAEYIVSRTYLDWIVNLPWNTFTNDNLNLKEVKKVLDEDHYDLENIKERIIEYLAVRKIKEDIRGPILCFVGPPGVGKTSLGMSIAKALGRKFYRMSLGGMRDEAEIRGHRRTYVGALPGRILQGIRKSVSNNPVFMLDEVDKIGQDFRGDPSSALLEVLDPEQNFSFSDNYLEVPFDLSKVMFIATANYLDPIPRVLLDRMEVIHLPGYTEMEKRFIARKHLIPKELEKHGLKNSQLSIPNSVIQKIVREYALEAGVRNLDRSIATICRKVAKFIAMGEKQKVNVTTKNLQKFLGIPLYLETKLLERLSPGVAVGLAWTPAGGEVLFVESTEMRGGKSFILTGYLGDVMKESAQTALSYVRSNADKFGIKQDFDKFDIHIHVPAGSIPKDGPSAGITIATSLMSLFLKKPIKPYLAMTGEITLRGDIMAIGGLKEKSLAAHRAGIKEIIIPFDNKKDIEEFSPEIKKTIKFIPLKKVEDVINYALGLEK